MQHYLITRFNIKISDDFNNKDGNEIRLDSNYLERRFELFYKYTVPSVIEQYNKKFIWVLMFSDRTPQKFKKKIIEWCEVESTIEIELMFIDDNKNAMNELRGYIEDNTTDKDSFITTRIDNDDAIHKNFIEDIQLAAKKCQKTTLLSFPKGYQFDIRNNLLSHYQFKKNHFTSLYFINKNEKKIQTIIDFDHMMISNVFPTCYISANQQRWLEIVHGENLLNRMFINKDSIETNYSVLKDYALNDELKEPSKQMKILFILFNKPINGYFLFKKFGFRGVMKKIINKFRGN